MEQPNTIEENISRLMDSIKESAEYQEFQKQNAILKQNPELKSRVMLSGQRITASRMNAMRTIYLMSWNRWKESLRNCADLRK